MARTKRRSVYLMERKTRKTLRSIITFKREIKIGISNDAQVRRDQVNSGIKGNIVLIVSYRINEASKVEAELHKKYKDANFTIRNAKKGAGGTEFFRLSTREVTEIKKELAKKAGIKDKKNSNIQIVIILIFVLYLLLRIYLTKT